MKIFIILAIFLQISYAQKVEITADTLEADENRHISILDGNVNITKGKDHIRANRVIIKFDEKNKPIEYRATGDIRFNIKTQNREFSGRSDKLIYNPKTLRYELLGNAVITEKSQNQQLIGQKIVIDRTSGKSKIVGGKNRPVKFIFDVKEQ